MKPILHENNGRTFCLVPVPEGSDVVNIASPTNQTFQVLQFAGQVPSMELPAGEWQLIGLSDDLNEDQSGLMVTAHWQYGNENGKIWYNEGCDNSVKLVPLYICGYTDYDEEAKPYETCMTSKESLSSLMLSLGLSGNVAVLEQK